jgi:type I restriction enzyme S subunit
MNKLPDGWKQGRFGDLFKVKYGKAIDKSLRMEGAEYPVVGSAGVMTYTKSPLTSEPTIVIGRKGNVGSIQVFKNGCYPIDTTYYMSTSSEFEINFLTYLLTSLELVKLDSSTATPSLRREDLENVLLVIPPIDEQNRIVEILEKHLTRLDNTLIDLKQSKLKAAQFRRSILELTTTGRFYKQETIQNNKISNRWELKRLADCLEKLNSGKLAERGWSPQCLNHPVRIENTWGVLKTTAVQMGEYKPEYNKELPSSLEPKIGLEVNSGDFLVTTTGPRNRCGIVCNVKKTPSKLIFSGKILRFRANEKIILSNWLMFVLMSPEFQKTFDKLKVGTSDSSVSIGNQQVLDLYIPVPEIAEQLKIIEMLEEQLSRLDWTVRMVEEIESQSIGLRRTLLHSAFNGKLKNEVVSV